MTIEIVAADLFFPEGPRWSHAENCLYFSDIFGKRVCRIRGGEIENIFEPEERPSGLGWLPNGDLLVVMTESQTLVRLPKAQVLSGNCRASDATVYADISTPYGTVANDMTVFQGVAYAGVALVPGLDEEALPGPRNVPRMGYMIKVNAAGESQIVSSRVCFPNGSCVTPDGNTLILAETFSFLLSAWDITSDGSLTNRRPWAYLGVPTDGITLDAEGCIWVACPYFRLGDGGGYLRVSPEGEVRQVIEIGDANKSAYACFLGGKDGKDLYLCESTVLGQGHERHPGDGRIRMTRVDVPSAFMA